MKARVIIATASVIKFEEALLSAAIPFTRDPRVSKLFESKQRYKDMHEEDNWLKLLQDKIEDIDRNRIQPKKKSWQKSTFLQSIINYWVIFLPFYSFPNILVQCVVWLMQRCENFSANVCQINLLCVENSILEFCYPLANTYFINRLQVDLNVLLNKHYILNIYWIH